MSEPDTPDLTGLVQHPSHPVMLADLTWSELTARVNDSVFVLPIGAIEAHGPHLPLGTDTVIANELAKRFAARTQDCVLLPPICYGARTNPARVGGAFPGNAGIRATTLMALLLDVMRAAYQQGARRFLILQAHYANTAFIVEAVTDFIDYAPGATVMAASWWELTSELTRNAIAAETQVPRTDDNHAALVETSLVLHLAPHLVRTHLIADDTSARRIRYAVLPVPDEVRTGTGIVHRAHGATAAIGARLSAEVLDTLCSAAAVELGTTPAVVSPPLADPAPGVVWFTGLPSAGKAAIIETLAAELRARRVPVAVLDDEMLRSGLNSDLGSSMADRKEDLRRLGEVAALMAQGGLVVLVTAITPLTANRAATRAKATPLPFLEVFVDTSPEIAERRDVEGLHARACGEIPDRISGSAYEVPMVSEVRVETATSTPGECAAEVLASLTGRGIEGFPLKSSVGLTWGEESLKSYQW
ncbi:creatininase family protein [Salinispora arenicola]|uniref:creatininase family protein n=1 Tax=Salinispora arenicola TaxID=168697 RepID=UPI000365DFC1|nr:creatininase family protein [Salinispora arenicola]